MADLSKSTVKQLRDLAAAHGIKPPSGLKKAELIYYIQAAATEISQGYDFKQERQPKALPLNQVQTVAMPSGIPNLLEDDSGKWLWHLNRFGWAVVQNVLTPEEVTTSKNSFWEWMQSCASTLDPIRSETWSYNQLPCNNKGMFKNYIGHQRFIWNIRRKCKPVFEKIYGTTDICTSFDGACFSIPKQTTSYTPWFHHDQPREYTEFVCVQGVVCLTDSGTQDGGFCYIQPSERKVGEYFNEYNQRHLSNGIKWAKVDLTDPMVSGVPVRKVCAPAGSVILFDSRLMHANLPSTAGYRMAVYVSYQPRFNLTEENKKKRLEAFNQNRMTSHWCWGRYFGVEPEHPHTYGAPRHLPSLCDKPSLQEVADLI